MIDPQELRVVIQDIYHLPQSTANGLKYCGKRDGLRIPQAGDFGDELQLADWTNFLESTNSVMRALAEAKNMVNRLKSLDVSTRINWPADIQTIKKYKTTARK